MSERLDVLLIEDNDDHSRLVLKCLNDHPETSRVHCFHDGKEALDYLFRKGTYAKDDTVSMPKIILLDVYLEDIDGYEVLKRIKEDENLRKIPVIVFSSNESEEDIDKAYTLYANSYLIKALYFDKFKETLDETVAYWMNFNTFASV